MAVESSSSADDSETAPLVTPRWAMPALIALAGATAIALVLTGQVVFGLVLAAAVAVMVPLARIFRTRLRAFDRRARADRATYGTLALVGVGWMILGVWRLTGPSSDLILGAVSVVFGLLMVLAYAPAFFRLRSLP